MPLEGQSQVASLILGLVYGRTHTPIGCHGWALTFIALLTAVAVIHVPCCASSRTRTAFAGAYVRILSFSGRYALAELSDNHRTHLSQGIRGPSLHHSADVCRHKFTIFAVTPAYALLIKVLLQERISFFTASEAA
jgi:hypothetical protein